MKHPEKSSPESEENRTQGTARGVESGSTTNSKLADRFFQAPNALLFEEALTDRAKLIYCVLRMYADNKSGECYPSLETISKITQLSRKTVKYHLQILVSSRWVDRRFEKKKGRYMGYVYKTYTGGKI
jgi:hypothetical protein